jgi:small subunit ribosomal protein S21
VFRACKLTCRVFGYPGVFEMKGEVSRLGVETPNLLKIKERRVRHRLFSRALYLSMATVRVEVKVDGDFRKALRRFKKKTEREGIIRDIKKNMAFEKPSAVRRRKKIKAIRRARKNRIKELKEKA